MPVMRPLWRTAGRSHGTASGRDATAVAAQPAASAVVVPARRGGTDPQAATRRGLGLPVAAVPVAAAVVVMEAGAAHQDQGLPVAAVPVAAQVVAVEAAVVQHRTLAEEPCRLRASTHRGRGLEAAVGAALVAEEPAAGAAGAEALPAHHRVGGDLRPGPVPGCPRVSKWGHPPARTPCCDRTILP